MNQEGHFDKNLSAKKGQNFTYKWSRLLGNLVFLKVGFFVPRFARLGKPRPRSAGYNRALKTLRVFRAPNFVGDCSREGVIAFRGAG